MKNSKGFRQDFDEFRSGFSDFKLSGFMDIKPEVFQVGFKGFLRAIPAISGRISEILRRISRMSSGFQRF